jgi:hypothetical protein
MAKVTLMKREPTHVQIANRAFEIYVSRGGEHGHDVGDWFEAERQLRNELQPRSERQANLDGLAPHFPFSPRGSTVSACCSTTRRTRAESEGDGTVQVA